MGFPRSLSFHCFAYDGAAPSPLERIITDQTRQIRVFRSCIHDARGYTGPVCWMEPLLLVRSLGKDKMLDMQSKSSSLHPRIARPEPDPRMYTYVPRSLQRESGGCWCDRWRRNDPRIRVSSRAGKGAESPWGTGISRVGPLLAKRNCGLCVPCFRSSGFLIAPT